MATSSTRALKIVHVAELMGKNFRIPSYQRGYRWERKQIEQLLNDLAEFSRSLKEAQRKDGRNALLNKQNPNNPQKPVDNEANIGYYCLQPLVVTEQKKNFYDVIDGQQRLTTIYLILCYLSATDNRRVPYNSNVLLADSLYKLRYQSREDIFFQQKLFETGSDKSIDNIDFYFMSMGYEVIKEWFLRNPNNENDILELLLPARYDSEDEELNDYQLHDVRFIWYETSAKTSIQTFNNLNYGKIGLTAAELVKALLFECDRYEKAERVIEKSNAVARSLKWSAMEECLQDEFFWGMLTPKQESKDLRLELILSFVATDIDKTMHYSDQEGWKKGDSDWVFNVFSKAISDKKLKDGQDNELGSVTQRVEYLWDRIQKVYTVFRNWFEDRELYHRIGLYTFIAVYYDGKRHQDVIRTIYKLYAENLKTVFKDKLREMIGTAVRITAKKDSKEEDNNDNGNAIESSLKKLEELNYKEGDEKAIRKILLLFNVEMTLKNSQEESRFPFHLASELGFNLHSLEHIHPQHLDPDEIKYGDLKKWFEERVVILEEKKVIGGYGKERLMEAIKNLRENFCDEKKFNARKSACIRDLEEVDKVFDELAGMQPKIMHSLRNLALVDERTNTALSNKLLDAKRQILIERTKNKETYVPLGTWYAFSKHFSDSVKDLQFWTEKDRNVYFAEIEKVYNDFAK